MARTYTQAALAGVTPQTITWARAWVRFWARDKPNEVFAYPPGSLEDEEIDAALNLHAALDGSTPYYRPHEVAALIIESDPERLTRFSGSGYSEEYVDVNMAASSIRSQGRRVDATIEEMTNGRISISGVTRLDPAW
jgi:hypothetical protein